MNATFSGRPAAVRSSTFADWTTGSQRGVWTTSAKISYATPALTDSVVETSLLRGRGWLAWAMAGEVMPDDIATAMPKRSVQQFRAVEPSRAALRPCWDPAIPVAAA